MLTRNTYEKEYVDACRARVDGLLRHHRELSDAAAALKGTARTHVCGAVVALEEQMFTQAVVTLDASFAHRTRALEGKDGNPMNEVRVLAASVLENDGVMLSGHGVRLRPESSVLGIRPGDRISLTENDFRRLADAFFDAVEATYVRIPEQRARAAG